MFVGPDQQRHINSRISTPVPNPGVLPRHTWKLAGASETAIWLRCPHINTAMTHGGSEIFVPVGAVESLTIAVKKDVQGTPGSS